MAALAFPSEFRLPKPEAVAASAQYRLLGEGDHPVCTERSEGRPGKPQVAGFAEAGACRTQRSRRPPPRIPGLATNKVARVSGPAMALAKGASPEWAKTGPQS